MSNLKVSTKLIVSFLIVAFLAGAVGASGIVGLVRMDSESELMYTEQMTPLSDLSQLTTLMERLRVDMREYVIAATSNDTQRMTTAYNEVNTLNQTINTHFDAYELTIKDAEAIRLFSETRAMFDGDYQGYLRQIYQLAQDGDVDGCIGVLDLAREDMATMIGNLDRCMELRLTSAGQTNEGIAVLARTLRIVIIAILVIALATAVFFAFYITKLISTPLVPLTGFMTQAATEGDLTLKPSDQEILNKFVKNRDEIGQLISATSGFFARLTTVSKELETIADNDLTTDFSVLSEKDTIGNSLRKMLGNLNQMFGEINSATGQVSTGAKQISDGAQSLASGSTEQAATVQELSAAISEIAEKTKYNAEIAGRAAGLAETIKHNAEKGSNQMDDMMNAVNEINQASQSISKVIRVIDDIAFQTNILALNAAVEAARAGVHGKGFAVVAEEVRDLAAKSADAAKDTGDMIANSMKKAELGARIANDTAASLGEIVSGINESSKIAADIARSSEEQSVGISQINDGIDQVSQVVQQNSATAQQSAAASQELSGQSEMLEGLVAQFKLKDAAAALRLNAPAPRLARKKIVLDDETADYLPKQVSLSDFGKY